MSVGLREHQRRRGSVTFVLSGAWLLWRAWRPRYHLRLETAKGTRKLSFGQLADEASIASLLADTTRMLEIPVKDGRRPTASPYRG